MAWLLLLLLGMASASESIRAYQALTYVKNGTVYGSQTATFNSFIGTLNNPELKIVLLNEQQFTSDNIKMLIEKKAYGVCVLINHLDSFIATKRFLEAYRYSLQNNHHMPLYFIDEAQKINARFGKVLQNPNSKLIATTGLGTNHAKLKLTDFIGEVKEPGSMSTTGNSRLIISAIDAYFGTDSKLIDFTLNGAGSLAHLSVARALIHVVDQYRDLPHNVIHYFSSTGFDNFSSIASYFKKNQHSYFTTGIDHCLVFKRISSEASFDITVYNVDESNRLDYDYLKAFEELAAAAGIIVNVNFKPTPFIVGLTMPTVVIDDEPKSEKFNQQGFESKVALITEFVISDAVSIKSKKLIEVLAEKTKPSEFISEYKQTLTTSSRTPYNLQVDSHFTRDFEQQFTSVVKKSVSYEYTIPGLVIYESQAVTLKLVDSKGSFFDLIAFTLIAGLVVGLQYACKFVGYNVESKSKDN